MATRDRGSHPTHGDGDPGRTNERTDKGRDDAIGRFPGRVADSNKPRAEMTRIGKPLHGYEGASATVLPTKLYFRIGEVASALGVETHVLRYWETEFRSIRPQKSSRGQRVYSRRDVDTLMRIKELLYERGFTIAGARKQLRDGGIEPREAADPTLRGANRMRLALLEIRADVVRLLETLQRVP